jgi:hypothetical protein
MEFTLGLQSPFHEPSGLGTVKCCNGTVDFINGKSFQFWAQISERFMSIDNYFKQLKAPIVVCDLEEAV